MKLFKWLTILCLCLIFNALNAQDMTATALLEKSMAYHDPDGTLFNQEVSMFFTETRPGGSDRKSSISFDIKNEMFQMRRPTEVGELVSSLHKGNARFTLAGDTTISQHQIDRYKISEKRLTTMKNYYQYLWLLPMKLKDPGTIIDPTVKEVDFFGRNLLQIRIEYEEAVGHDIWYFYFDPSTYALSGYRFYHDEEKGDGEYILLSDELQYEDIRLPQKRTWYTHQGDRLLGTDILDSIKIERLK